MMILVLYAEWGLELDPGAFSGTSANFKIVKVSISDKFPGNSLCFLHY